MKKKKKIALRRETLTRLSIGEVHGGTEVAVTDPIGSADLCKSCLCVSDPESVCLCSGGGRVQIA